MATEGNGKSKTEPVKSSAGSKAAKSAAGRSRAGAINNKDSRADSAAGSGAVKKKVRVRSKAAVGKSAKAKAKEPGKAKSKTGSRAKAETDIVKAGNVGAAGDSQEVPGSMNTDNEPGNEFTFTVNANQLGIIFGVAPRTVREWALAGMPRNGGRYDLRLCGPWIVDRKVSDIKPVSEAAKRLDEATADEREQRAAITKMKRKEMEGKLMPLEDVERDLLERIYAVKTALEVIPVSLAQPLAGVSEPGEIEEIIDNEIKMILDNFANDAEQKKAIEYFAGKLVEAVRPKLKGIVAVKNIKKLCDKIKKVITEV